MNIKIVHNNEVIIELDGDEEQEFIARAKAKGLTLNQALSEALQSWLAKKIASGTVGSA